ncbi:MAG: amidohydrolase family protein [Pseudomonadota bacterium]
MRILVLTLLLGMTASNAFAADAYLNGHWFENGRFVARNAYVVNGYLSFDAPSSIDNTYDLAGRYVIPPFAEAHNHDLTSDFEPQERINEYLASGVFYAKMQSAFSKGFEKLSAHYNKPDSVDVIFAFAPVTGPGGHPIRIRELFFDRGYYDEFFDNKAEMDGIGYTRVRDRAELEKKIPSLIDQKPDFLKFMLSHSEEYMLRRDDPEFFGYKGLDPRLAPVLVKLAHEAGLRITAHIDTAADFHNAVVAGVDEIAHLPGSRSIEVIRSKDAAMAAEKDIAVVTTISLTTKIKKAYPAYFERIMKQHANNLNRLKDAGVRILIGSDMPYRDNSVTEAFLLKDLSVFTNAEILSMWCETTARSIFPERKIGRLEEGYEASFLVLEGNPIEDFAYVRSINLRVKQGRRLNL